MPPSPPGSGRLLPAAEVANERIRALVDAAGGVWFMKFITTKSFMPFVYYRIALGILLYIRVGADVLSPHAGESAG
ncbi:hypothetical protein GCM10020367_08610 [Streptomyces sannanensis]|uniref:Uncharacterized protein n=1 Tax=Streptomyces sannanensis TaxID=285536 RepID=A0ABP6S5U0_9ACTN